MPFLKRFLYFIEINVDQDIYEIFNKSKDFLFNNLEIINKAVNIEVPRSLSDLTNDKTFKTESEIRALIQEVGRLKKEIVTELPVVTNADTNTLYLVENQQGTGYEEWMAINGAWEILGDTAAVDFTGYVHEDDLQAISNVEIDALLQAEGV